jgi:hypothetical protein
MHLVTKLGLNIFVDGGQPSYLTKLGDKKKPLLFCPHKNYPFKTFFFKNLETKKALEQIS